MALVQLFAVLCDDMGKRSEFAVYRMVGATRKHLIALINGEALLLGGCGAASSLCAERKEHGWLCTIRQFH